MQGPNNADRDNIVILIDKSMHCVRKNTIGHLDLFNCILKVKVNSSILFIIWDPTTILCSLGTTFYKQSKFQFLIAETITKVKKNLTPKVKVDGKNLM